MRILLAEDEKSLARALVTLLKKHHYEADAVYDGAEALAYLQTGNYDAAILDIMMPGMDGIEVLCRARESGVSLPILMLTAKGDRPGQRGQRLHDQALQRAGAFGPHPRHDARFPWNGYQPADDGQRDAGSDYL